MKEVTAVRAQEARDLGERIAVLVRHGQVPRAYSLLSQVLAERTPFDTLRRIGAPVGRCQLNQVDPFLDLIAEDKTEGGWVVISSVLQVQLDRDLPGVFVRCHDFIIAADVWYAADTLGEGVPGQALVSHFQPALELLAPWRMDDNTWARRAVGVAVHFWAKRSRGAAEHAARAEELLATLEPMFEEWDMSAVKGIGWGLKTLGKYYPDLIADWLPEQVGRRHRALMLHKALTYLSDEQRARAVGEEKT